VTEADILMLHRMDDCEVNANCKELKLDAWYKPFYDEWKEKYIADFEEKYGRKPFNDEIPGGHRRLESLDAISEDSEDEFGDQYRLQAEIAEQNAEEIPPEEERLAEIIADMPETWQCIYDLVILQRVTRRTVGRILGVSASYVGKIEKRIIKIISEDKKLNELLQ